MFKIENIMSNDGGGKHLYELTRQITKNIAYFLPKNIDVEQVRLIFLIIKFQNNFLYFIN